MTESFGRAPLVCIDEFLENRGSVAEGVGAGFPAIKSDQIAEHPRLANGVEQMTVLFPISTEGWAGIRNSSMEAWLVLLAVSGWSPGIPLCCLEKGLGPVAGRGASTGE